MAGEIRIEAESMTLSNYKRESNNFASGGQLIKTGGTGRATKAFSGPSGVYNVVIGYYDENDGQSRLTVRTSGKESTWLLNENSGSGNANAQTFRTKTVFTGLSLTKGQTIEIVGERNQGENARVDYIEFIPVPSANLPPIANDDSYSTVANTPLAIAAASGVLSNDTDANGDRLSVTGYTSTSTQGGAVAIHSDGSFTYSPAAGFAGSDTFTYTVGDGRGGSDTATVTVTVEPSGTPNPRLFLDAAQIDQIRAAIQVPGSHHQTAFNAMKARVDQNDWRVYDENLSDGNYNYARSWLAREASLMYLLTGNSAYAQTAFDALYAVHANPDPEGRLPESGYGLSRAMVGMGFAIAYDWAASGWTQAQRDYIREKIILSLNAWPSYTHSNLSSPWGSNWVAVTRGAEIVMMLAAREEGARSSRYATIKSQLQQHIQTAYGPTGWTQEGNGYLAYGGGFLLPAIYALRDVGDTSLEATFNAVDFWKLPLYAGAFDANQSALQFGVGGAGFDNEGWTSLLLAATPSDQLPYYQFFYDRYRGIHNAAPDSQKFDNRRAGTTWSLIYYPTSGTPIDPDGAYIHSLQDSDKGAYFFRNRWQDANDTLISLTGDFEWHSRAWDHSEAFSLGVFAYDTHFIGGPAKETAAQYFSTLLVDGARGGSRTTGAPNFFSATAEGGYVIVDGGTAYRGLGLEDADRHLLVNFSGDVGTALFSTLDQIRDSESHTYTWQLNLGDQSGNGGVSAIAGTEGGLSTFLLRGDHSSYLKGWILHPSNASLAVGDPLRVITSGANADLWSVMVAGTGAPPIATVIGTGMDAVLEIGNARVYYDDQTNRIVTESTGAVGTLMGTSGTNVLSGNAGANLLIGGLASDQLTGGSGADRFVYNAPTEGQDIITDFTVDDFIQISAAGFEAGLVSGTPLSNGTASTTGVFVLGSTPIGNQAHFLYDAGVLRFDPDGSGPQVSLGLVSLSGAPLLNASQILIVD